MINSISGDHPRRCGEKVLFKIVDNAHEGSPPQMRGKGVRDITQDFESRITPADAGKRTLSRQAENMRRDHPRRCGEKLCTKEPTQSAVGSPPQMRGKARKAMLITNSHRITPADAGKSTSHLRRLNHVGDHPRRCGEKKISC